MAKSSVADWSTDPASNTDVGGVDIAELCPPSSLNNAIRTVMAQIAAWIASAAGPLLKSGGALTGALTALGNASTIKDPAGTERAIGYRGVPQNPQTAAYVLALTDVGRRISITTGGVTVPANATVAFADDAAVTIYNNSSSAQTITQASGVTLRLAGSSTTGNRTLAQRGVATVLKVAANEWVIMGQGLT